MAMRKPRVENHAPHELHVYTAQPDIPSRCFCWPCADLGPEPFCIPAKGNSPSLLLQWAREEERCLSTGSKGMPLRMPSTEWLVSFCLYSNASWLLTVSLLRTCHQCVSRSIPQSLLLTRGAVFARLFGHPQTSPFLVFHSVLRHVKSAACTG